MRLAAKVLLPGTGWVAFKQLMDLVGLMMDLLGKRLFDFQTIKAVCDATISFTVQGTAFSKTYFEDTLSLRAVFVIVLARNLVIFMTLLNLIYLYSSLFIFIHLFSPLFIFVSLQAAINFCITTEFPFIIDLDLKRCPKKFNLS